MGYGLPDQGMMGSAGVYAGAPVVAFPGPSAAPATQAKPYYRCWDNTHKKWFYWEKDSNVTSWTEPAAHVTLIDHETGSVVAREPQVVPVRPVPVVTEAPSTNVSQAYPSNRAPVQSQAPASTVVSTSSVKPVQQQQSRFQPSISGTINPNYSAGVSRYTQPGGSTQSGLSAVEKARLEEADRLIAEKLQKQLSMEAEAELVASCPLPGEAAKLVASQKKKFTFSKPAAQQQPVKASDEEDIADMAKHGFVVKKQKPKKSAPASAAK
jgi:hypothetical protein